MTIVEKAKMVAEKYHRFQEYGEGLPYFYHLEQVANEVGRITAREDIICAAYLHDILEDTPLSYNDLVKMFNKDIADIVYNVTDELGKNRKERHEKTYPKIKSTYESCLLKICDRICNARHSLVTGSKMFKMYKAENEEFLSVVSYPVGYAIHLTDSERACLNRAYKTLVKLFE